MKTLGGEVVSSRVKVQGIVVIHAAKKRDADDQAYSEARAIIVIVFMDALLHVFVLVIFR